MAKALQRRRGTTEEHKSFTGLEGELTIDTDKHSIRVHDGVTAGGHEILPNCLPLSGGTMTGTIKSAENGSIARDGTDGYLGLFGSGTDWWNNGANLCLYGKGHSSNGQFAITAVGTVSGSVAKAALTGRPNGELLWNGNNVITSAGGTIAGVIEINRDTGHIYKKNASGRMIVRGGTGNGADGSSIYLHGKDYADNPSGFQVRIADGTNDKSLNCKPNGTFTWDGKNVVRSVNGTAADAAGNVELSVGVQAASSSTMGGIKPASAWVKILESTSNIGTYSYTATKNCFVCAYNMGGTNNMTVMAAIGGVTIYRDYGHHNDGNNSYPMLYLSKGQTLTITQNSAKLHFSVLDLE